MKPVLDAIKIGNISISQLDNIILAGGAKRTPFILKELEKIVGLDRLGKTVNADEAAVMGAIFRGAAVSNSSRLRNFM